MLLFLSTPSARRATDDDFFARFTRQISIHALREEGDATRLSVPRICEVGFLSTPSARRATLCLADVVDVFFISIHALREEGDPACIA